MFCIIPFSWTKYKFNKFGTIQWAFLCLLVNSTISGIVLLIIGIINAHIFLIIFGAALVVLGAASHLIFIPLLLAKLDKKEKLRVDIEQKKNLNIEIEKLKEIYPDFDYTVEMENKQFNELVRNYGCSLKDAYESMHNLS